MRDRLNIGLIGFGMMGRTHACAVENQKWYYTPSDPASKARITAVCTRHADTARTAAEGYGLGYPSTDEDELIYSPDIDIIDISTPNIYHFETAKKAILAKKHVLCEKPLTVTADEAEELARLASENGVTAQIVFNYRFLAPNRLAKRLTDEGRLGRILSFDIRYLHSSACDTGKPAGWKQTAEYGGGVFNDLGSHAVDLIYYICGGFKDIKGRAQIAYPVRTGPDGSEWKTDADEAFYALAELECGAVGTITASKIAVGTNDDLRYEIYGEKGALKFDLMEPNWLWLYDTGDKGGEFGGERGFRKIECVGRYPSPGDRFPGAKAPTGWMRSHIESYHSFLTAVSSGQKPCPSFDDAAHVQRVLERAYRSAE
ncbi:MAG: Gfo/Idh/MocA family oxidoreductase [Clostridia bacterium]|nr:Gfo/Idh/MocA family oxidoreductase [Clostridia bacterium]